MRRDKDRHKKQETETERWCNQMFSTMTIFKAPARADLLNWYTELMLICIGVQPSSPSTSPAQKFVSTSPPSCQPWRKTKKQRDSETRKTQTHRDSQSDGPSLRAFKPLLFQAKGGPRFLPALLEAEPCLSVGAWVGEGWPLTCPLEH